MDGVRKWLALFLIGFVCLELGLISAAQATDPAGQYCKQSLSSLAWSRRLSWESLDTPAARVLRERVAEAARRNQISLVAADRIPAYSVLPRGIPAELVPAFAHFNRIMGDNALFLRWMIGLEMEVAYELRFVANPSNQRRFEALSAVIRRRALAAGWPEEILILAPALPETEWRAMLSRGQLFIDSRFSDVSRNQEAPVHTEGAHLLQLLFASEVLNDIPELRQQARLRGDGNIVQTLMQFMGDSYRRDGRLIDTTGLDWSATPTPQDGSLWFELCDSTSSPPRFNRPENIGAVYHVFPNLSQIELWSSQRGPRYRGRTAPP